MTFQYTGQPAAVPRCQVCDWPLAASIEDGCVPNNCSYRPEQGSEEYARISRRRRELEAAERVTKLRPLARRMLLTMQAGGLISKAIEFRECAKRAELPERQRDLFLAIADEHDALASDLLARLVSEAVSS